MEEIRSFTSVADAKAWVNKAAAEALAKIRALPPEWAETLSPADDPIMPGLPQFRVITAMIEHTAHHRGSLAVYLRLLGKVPPVPYF